MGWLGDDAHGSVDAVKYEVGEEVGLHRGGGPLLWQMFLSPLTLLFSS